MGRAKEEMMRLEELQPMFEWIEDNIGEDAGEEGSDTWEEAVEAFESYCVEQQEKEEEWSRQEEEWYRLEELEWYLYSKSQIGIFDAQMKNVLELLDVEATSEAQFSLLVMLYGHTVASIESYLASTFIQRVTNSESLIRKLVETDPVFSDMKFTMKEFFEEKDNLNVTIAKYLKDLIFHNLKKVKPMFKDVLDCDFGDIAWLFKAVVIRHHCVHRAGLDNDGKRIDISVDSIRELVEKSSLFVEEVELKSTQFVEMANL